MKNTKTITSKYYLDMSDKGYTLSDLATLVKLNTPDSTGATVSAVIKTERDYYDESLDFLIEYSWERPLTEREITQKRIARARAKAREEKEKKEIEERERKQYEKLRAKFEGNMEKTS